MHIPPNFEQMPLRPQKLMFEEVCESRVVFIFFVYRDSTFAFKATKWRTNAVTVVSYLLIVAFVQFVCFVCFGCTILAAARWKHMCTTRGYILFACAYTMLFPLSASHLSSSLSLLLEHLCWGLWKTVPWLPPLWQHGAVPHDAERVQTAGDCHLSGHGPTLIPSGAAVSGRLVGHVQDCRFLIFSRRTCDVAVRHDNTFPGVVRSA